MIAVWHGEARLCHLLLTSPSVTENLHKHAMLAAFLVSRREWLRSISKWFRTTL